MEKNKNFMIEKLNQGLEKLNLSFSQEQILKLEIYIQEVLEFNKSYNLMKATNADELAVNHVLDSLAAVESLTKIIKNLTEQNKISSLQIGDIGSGGGCPGIPLAVAFPEQNFTLVERMEKRCAFLQSTIQKMNLQNVKINSCNADNVLPESFDLEVFRAFHPFDKKIIKLLFKILKKGGFIAAYKARYEKIISEMQEIQNFIDDYKIVKLSVPFLEDHERNLVIIQK